MNRLIKDKPRLTALCVSLLSLGFLLFIAPFIIISFFNYPGAEDYAEVVLAQEFGFFGYIRELYLTWDGRFFTAILFGLHPLVFHSFFLYKLFPIILFVLLFISIVFFIHSTGVFNKQKHTVFSISIILFILCIYNTPSTVSAFYYYIMSGIYTPPVIGSLLLFATIIHINKTRHSLKKLSLIIFSIFLVYSIIGSLEIFIGIILFSLLLLFVYQIKLNKPEKKETAILLASAFSAAYLHISAPGIRVYFNQNPMPINTERFFSAVKNCIVVSNGAFLDFISGNYLLVLASIYFILLLPKSENDNTPFKKLKLSHVVIAIIFIIITLHVLAFPYFWSLGDDAGQFYPKRLFSSIYVVFLFSWFTMLYIAFSYIRPKIKGKFNHYHFAKLKPLISVFIIICIPYSPAWKTAVDDLLSGRAYGYHLEMQDRISKFKSADSNTRVWIDPLEHKPKTIYSFVDLAPYRGSGWNDAYEEYFEVQEIIFNKNLDEQ
ncbi:MAG: hypothetical protein WD048_11930 [Chitinophagales bacterium]